MPAVAIRGTFITLIKYRQLRRSTLTFHFKSGQALFTAVTRPIANRLRYRYTLLNRRTARVLINTRKRNTAPFASISIASEVKVDVVVLF